MKKITAITQFIQEISTLIDKGISISSQEVEKHIQNKDVIDWLEQLYPVGSNNRIDFSLFNRADRNYVHDQLESYLIGYGGGRKWGIINNGLCLLISWSTEIVRDIHGRDLENPSEWIK